MFYFIKIKGDTTMKKKIICAIVCSMLLAGTCACKHNTSDPLPTGAPTQGADQGNTSGTVTPEATPEPTPTIPITDYAATVSKTKLPETYIGIKVAKVTDKEVDDYVTQILQENAELVPQDRAAELGDTTDIHYVGTLDGVAFEGGTGDYELMLGSQSFIDGFEEGLVGAVKGETRVLNLNFPDPYTNDPSMAGKAVVFTVDVNEVLSYVIPELSDAFVSELTAGDCAKASDFHEYIRNILQQEKAYNAVSQYLTENTEYTDLNEAYIQQSYDEMVAYYTDYAGMYSLDLDTFLMYNGILDPQAFWGEVKNDLTRQEKERVALFCVAKNENMELSDAEFTEKATAIAADYGQSLEDFLAEQPIEYVKNSILMEKALDFLIQNASVE